MEKLLFGYALLPNPRINVTLCTDAFDNIVLVC